jgi:hypothetical protein
MNRHVQANVCPIPLDRPHEPIPPPQLVHHDPPRIVQIRQPLDQPHARIRATSSGAMFGAPALPV